MEKLLLIDGNAILHRAFHAYPDTFSDGNGHPTNAIYGFYAMLLKVMEEVKPDLLTICFDQGAPTFRMNLYVGYHANRPKMQDKLGEQVEPLRESLQKIGIPLDAVDGYEADDLIGTLSHQAKQKGLETIILTGDRDLLQLVNGSVKLLMPITGITKSVVMGSQEVEDKYGITPSQVIDYKALVGDPSDNYPGVAGIGPKTASSLLQKFGTLENIYSHLGDIKPELSQKLAKDAEAAGLCKKLATIHLDAPVHLDTKASDVAQFTPEKFLDVFEQFNIHSLARRLSGLGEEKQVVKKQHEGGSSLGANKKIGGKKKSDDQLELL
ncbi:MAG TPA: 5'-3' exonuclease H3TH domain-containing protein [Patescibacteria group bacterium]|nr:5'-3' exonuclease H3TH domain-containing protein [Patescibacteria group bacterium]